jgi:DNA-binding GntR family transcriptional regulator
VPARPLLREQVYERIRDWIVEGQLPPETRLRDVEIAEALQVSRTPVREAIRRLEDEGLVVAEASRWTRVAPLDTGTADRLYPIIWTLERLAITLAEVPWDVTRIALLKSENDELARALRRGDARAASEADTTFHRQLVVAADNADLTAIVDDLKIRLRRIEIAYFGGAIAGEQSLDEHERIIEALAGNDLGRAQDALEHNWRKSLERLRERQARD